jgi:molybdate transport system substrate-binding protein
VVLSKVALGEADGGIVYASDVSGEGVAGVGRIEVPDQLNPLATYPIAPIGDSAQAELARAFVEFVLSPDGQATLSRHGFMAAKP